jgi:predicted  nucleic acid-binding Zn-ribbon protein
MSVYTKTVWKNGDVITSAKLNKIETGIFNISADVNAINVTVTSLNESVNTTNTSIAEANAKLDALSNSLESIDFDSILTRLNDAILAIQTNATNRATNVANISNNRNLIDELEENQLVGEPISEEAITNLFKDDKAEEENN